MWDWQLSAHRRWWHNYGLLILLYLIAAFDDIDHWWFLEQRKHETWNSFLEANLKMHTLLLVNISIWMVSCPIIQEQCIFWQISVITSFWSIIKMHIFIFSGHCYAYKPVIMPLNPFSWPFLLTFKLSMMKNHLQDEKMSLFSDFMCHYTLFVIVSENLKIGRVCTFNVFHYILLSGTRKYI